MNTKNSFIASMSICIALATTTAQAGIGRHILDCGSCNVTQSEEPLSWDKKPGIPGQHDEYILISGVTTTDDAFLGSFKDSAGKIHALWSQDQTNVELEMNDSIFSPGTTEQVVRNGKYPITCTSTEFTSRLLLRHYIQK